MNFYLKYEFQNFTSPYISEALLTKFDANSHQIHGFMDLLDRQSQT